MNLFLISEVVQLDKQSTHRLMPVKFSVRFLYKYKRHVTLLLEVPGLKYSRKNSSFKHKALFLIFFSFVLSYSFSSLEGDPELDAQVPAADLPGAAARGGGRSARHQHTAGALQELRIPRDTVYRRHRLSKPTGTSCGCYRSQSIPSVRTISLNS
jgi:hypothetical protein